MKHKLYNIMKILSHFIIKYDIINFYFYFIFSFDMFSNWNNSISIKIKFLYNMDSFYFKNLCRKELKKKLKNNNDIIQSKKDREILKFWRKFNR